MLWLSLLACKPEPVVCTSTELAFDDDPSEHLGAWPDDRYTVEASSPTGRVIDLSQAGWVDDQASLIQDLFLQSEGKSGFATVGEVLLRFTGPLPKADAGVALYELGANGPVLVPTEARLADDDTDLYLRPLRPLATGTEHMALVTHEAAGSDRCIAPGPQLSQDLDEGRHDATLQALELTVADVGALTTFTTHADHQPFLDAADAAYPVAGWGPLDCFEEHGLNRCETTFEPQDFREPGGVVVDSAQGSHVVPVTWWLPEGPPGKVVMLGHGLNGGRDASHIRQVAERLVPLGFACVATDALAHNDHPTATGGGAMDFLGLDIAAFRFDGSKTQSNFQQSILERHQLLKLLKQDADLDGDGVDDVDADRIAYLGISLGALLGTGLLAVNDDIEAATLPVGGGDLISIVRDSEVMEDVLPLLTNLAGNQADLDAYLAAMQTIVDPADPALWGTYVLDEAAPDLLFQVALHDQVVPPSAGRALARGFGIPQVGVVEQPVAPLTEQPGYPVQGNHASGATVGMVQFDMLDGRPAVHDDAGHPLVIGQSLAFLESWGAGQTVISAPE